MSDCLRDRTNKKRDTKGKMARSIFASGFSFLLLILVMCHSAFAQAKPRVALVLSGGGARGGAHIGVLRVLEREGVPIDLIVGASYGSLIGGLYAAGYSIDDIERIVAETNWQDMTDDSPDRRLLNLNRKPSGDRQLIALRLDKLEPQLPEGIFAGQKIQQFLNRLTIGPTYKAQNDFDRLPVSFRAIATDVLSGEQVVLKSGMLSTAMRASIAVPGLFVPVSTEHTYLVDGGIANNLPVDVALDAGADFVIAVDCATPLRSHKDEIEDFIDVFDQAISYRIEERKIANRERAHVLIMPDLKGFDTSEFNRSHLLAPAGKKEAELHLDAIWDGLNVLGVGRDTANVRTSLLPLRFDSKTWAGLPLEMVIDRVRIAGLQRYSIEIFASRLERLVGETVTLSELDEEASWFYATGLFQAVDYQIFYREGKTELVFQVRETSPSELKVGLHYDQDFQLLALGELARRNVLERIPEFYFQGMIGKINFVQTGFVFRPPVGPRLFGNVRWWDQERLFLHNGQRVDAYKERRFRSRVGLQVLLRSWGSLKAGYQFEHVGLREAALSVGDVSSNLTSLWASAQVDTRDDAFLPRHGIYFGGLAKWVHRPVSYRQMQAHLAYFASPNSRLSVGIQSDWGFVTQSAPTHDHIHVGGAGHFSMASMRFVGLKRDALRLSRFVSAGFSVWNHLATSGALANSAVGVFYQGGLYNQAPNLKKLDTWIHGFGIGFYMRTRILGPIRLDVVGTDEKDLQIYTSMGFAF